MAGQDRGVTSDEFVGKLQRGIGGHVLQPVGGRTTLREVSDKIGNLPALCRRGSQNADDGKRRVTRHESVQFAPIRLDLEAEKNPAVRLVADDLFTGAILHPGDDIG